jgi:hypothetical protein
MVWSGHCYLLIASLVASRIQEIYSSYFRLDYLTFSATLCGALLFAYPGLLLLD